MKGGEGCFLVVLSITVCMPDIYIDMVKGDGFFSFRFSNFRFCSISRYVDIKIWGFFFLKAKIVWRFWSNIFY